MANELLELGRIKTNIINIGTSKTDIYTCTFNSSIKFQNEFIIFPFGTSRIRFETYDIFNINNLISSIYILN